jgi:hypothetical protein
MSKRAFRRLSMITQGITYPFCVVKINSKKKLLLNKKATISSGFFYTNSLILELVLKT